MKTETFPGGEVLGTLKEIKLDGFGLFSEVEGRVS